MKCDECNHGSKACERVRTINGFAGSMDCDKTPEKVRWAVNTLNIYGWAMERYRILMDMMAEDNSPFRVEYINGERKKVEAALKEQWGKEPR